MTTTPGSDNRMMLDSSCLCDSTTMCSHREYEEFRQQYILFFFLLETVSTSRLSTSEDLEVSDTSDPLLCDSDVAGSGATLNDNAVNIDVDISSDCDVGGRHVSSCSLTQSMSSSATVLSNLLSMIEYAKKTRACKYCETPQCATCVRVQH